MTRRQAYEFEHIVLRDAALLDPVLFLWASRHPHADEKLRNIWRRCAGEEESIPADELSVQVDARPGLCTVVVTLPAPAAPTECWLAAAVIALPPALVEKINDAEPGVPATDPLDRALKVLVGTNSWEERQTWNIPVLFFTLERGDLEGNPRTVLCQWQRDDDGGMRHVNHGDGPEPTRQALLLAVGRILAESVEPAQA